MIRALRCFGISQPCSAPLQVVAYTHTHALSVLLAVCRMGCGPGRDEVCSQAQKRLHAELVSPAGSSAEEITKWLSLADVRCQLSHMMFRLLHSQPHYAFSAALQSYAQVQAKLAVRRVQTRFTSFRQLQQLAHWRPKKWSETGAWMPYS